MGGQDSWKRTEEIEIDLRDFLQRFCRQWKWGFAFAIICAALLSGYQWINNGNVLNENESAPGIETELTEEEEQGVAAAVQMESEIEELETYLEQSVLMKINPYHKARYIMLYSIEYAKRQELQKITESYLNFLGNGGAADALRKSDGGEWKMDKSYLAELISAYQRTYSPPYQAAAEEADELTEMVFYVEITGNDAESAKKMAQDVQNILEAYAADVKAAAGSHRLVLVSSAESVTADSGLQAQQREKRSLLTSSRTNLKAVTDAFSKGQMAAYQDAAGVEAEEENGDLDNASNSVFNIKYIILGCVAGIFIYGGIFLCWYFFFDTVKSETELKRMYKFPIYGSIFIEGKRKKRFRFLPHIGSSSENGQEQILSRIRLACKKKEIFRICAASDGPLSVEEKECLERMAEKLKGWGIDMTVAENTGSDAAVWDVLADTGSVLLVCRIGMTTHQMIDDAMSFYLENGITAAGAVVFSENE